METLGMRIRSLRKSKKMTLVDLAADKMTKGMLSLIENDKAKPSIENLHYIANKLEVSIGDLTDDFSQRQLRALLDQLRDKNLIKHSYTKKEATEVYEFLSPIIDRLPQQYETSRLFIYYLQSFIPLKKSEEGIAAANKALDLFKHLSLYNDYVAILINKTKYYFMLKEYKLAYHTIAEAYEMTSSSYYSIDATTKIQTLYHMSAFSLATNRIAEAQNIIDEMLDYCHETKIFYLYALSLGLAISSSILNNNHEKVPTYMDLMNRYTQFDRTDESLIYYYLFQMIYYNNYEKDAQKVIEMYNKISSFELLTFETYIHAELGKAYFNLGRDEEALDALHSLTPKYIEENHLHPLDLLIILKSLCIKALLLQKQNEHQEALSYVTFAHEYAKPFDFLQGYDFIRETWQTISSTNK